MTFNRFSRLARSRRYGFVSSVEASSTTITSTSQLPGIVSNKLRRQARVMSTPLYTGITIDVLGRWLCT
jgi:hypothetical protein